MTELLLSRKYGCYDLGRIALEKNLPVADRKSQNTVEELSSLVGGAKIILGTASSEKAMTSVLGGMAVNGKIIMIGAFDESLEISTHLFISGRRLVGWPAGTSMDSEDTLSFSVLSPESDL